MSLLKLARDPFKIESGAWLRFDESNAVKVLPIFNPKVSEKYYDILETEKVDLLAIADLTEKDPEKAFRIMEAIFGVIISDWEGMSVNEGKASEEELIANLKDKRFEHLASRILVFFVTEGPYRPDEEVVVTEDVVKN